MTEQKTKPVPKQATTSKTTGKNKVTKTVALLTAKKTVAKKPVTKKAETSSSKKKATGIATPKKTAVSSKAKPVPVKDVQQKPTPEERYRMVEVTAYFIAERNGFQGDATEHWVAAEREVKRILGY